MLNNFDLVLTSLGHTPLLWLTLTILVYLAGQIVQRRSGAMPLANPVLIAIVLMVTLLELSGTTYQTYFAGAQYLHFLLGPATVALAIPLANNFRHVLDSVKGASLALLAGCLTSIISGAAIVWLLGGGRSLMLSMAPKAVTTPIAMAVSEQVGGVPALTAALVIAGGILVAIIGPTVMRWLRIYDWRAHGLAAGVSGSAVGAAQAAGLHSQAAAFAALGVGLNGLLTALLLPLLIQALLRYPDRRNCPQSL